MFFKRTMVREKIEFDHEEKIPVIKCSICNEEQVAGLKELKTGKFEEIMMIRGEEDLRIFKDLCGMEEIRKEY